MGRGFGTHTGDIAAALAMHFVRGHQMPQAVQYVTQAEQHAARLGALREAVDYLTMALELLRTGTCTPERLQQELVIQIALGRSLAIMEGFAHPDTGRAFYQARILCQHVGDTSQRLAVLRGL